MNFLSNMIKTSSNIKGQIWPCHRNHYWENLKLQWSKVKQNIYNQYILKTDFTNKKIIEI